jgi:hypothetical protein
VVKTIDATFDGKVLRPDDPLGLAPNTRVRLTIEAVEPAATAGQSFLDVARSLQLDGPADWAEHLESYLYGGDAQGGPHVG